MKPRDFAMLGVLFALALCLSLPLSGWAGYKLAEVRLVREYSRGMYDVCVLVATRLGGETPEQAMGLCLESVRASAEILFREESPGFLWP